MLGAAMALGENIKRLRERAKLSQTDLAEAMKMKPQRIWDWENNRRKTLNMRTLIKLATALNCSTDEILGGIDGYQLRAQQTASKEGGSDVPASAGLESDRFEPHYREFVLESRRIANRLIELIAEHEIRSQSGAPETTQTRVRRRDRKVG